MMLLPLVRGIWTVCVSIWLGLGSEGGVIVVKGVVFLM